MKKEGVSAVGVGGLLDGRVQEGWVLESLRQALAVPGVSLAAVAVARGNSRKSFASRLNRVIDRLEEQVRCRKERLFVPTDVAAELSVPPLNVKITRHGNRLCPGEPGTAALRRCDVEVVLCFAAIPPRRPLP